MLPFRDGWGSVLPGYGGSWLVFFFGSARWDAVSTTYGDILNVCSDCNKLVLGVSTSPNKLSVIRNTVPLHTQGSSLQARGRLIKHVLGALNSKRSHQNPSEPKHQYLKQEALDQ